jgi:hypothetical protein
MSGLVWLVWSAQAGARTGAAVLAPAVSCLSVARALWATGGVDSMSVEEQGSRPSTGWSWRAAPRGAHVSRAVLP